MKTLRIAAILYVFVYPMLVHAAEDYYPWASWDSAATENYNLDNRTGSEVRWIVIHTTEGTFGSAINRFKNPTQEVSAHYVISRGGDIVQMVANSDIAFTAGNYDYNKASLNIEIERYDGAGVVPTQEQYQACANLCNWLASEFSVSKTIRSTEIAPADPYSGGGIIGHRNVPDPDNPEIGGGENHKTDPINWDWAKFENLLSTGEDTMKPEIENFVVHPTGIAPGDSFTISFTASDSGGSGLDFAQVWWTEDNGGSPDGNWVQYEDDLPLHSYGNGPKEVDYQITPPAGVYWFGIHLNDLAGNYTTEEEAGFSPQRVSISSEASTPNLEYLSHRIDDDHPDANGDGIANPGEIIDLHITLLNDGSATAHNIAASISTKSPYVDIADDKRTWDDLPAGDSNKNSGDFDFTVDANCPDGHVITFTVQITSNEGEWTDFFTTTVVVNPVVSGLVYGGSEIRDGTGGGRGNQNGQMDAGEEIALNVMITNRGSTSATNITATISTDDPENVIVQKASVDLPVIEANDTLPLNDAFAFIVRRTCPVGSTISFDLSLRSDQGDSTSTFEIQVMDKLPAFPLRPKVYSIRPGQLTIEFRSIATIPYTLWESDDLVRWDKLSTYPGRAVFTRIRLKGAIGTASKRYYRITVP